MARTTPAIRKEIRESSETVQVLADRYHINPSTVQKWKKREDTSDRSSRHTVVRSTSLTEEEEAIIVKMRKGQQFSYYDLLYKMQETIPHLTESSFYRLLKRHGINRLPKSQENVKKKEFAETEIGYFHIDISQVHVKNERLYMFAGIDRVSKYLYTETYPRQTGDNAALFLRHLIECVPYRIHTILTDNGAQFVGRPGAKTIKSQFGTLCLENNIKQKRTKPYSPQTNGQVERTNRTLKEATVKKYYYETKEVFVRHLNAFVNMYNYTKRLRALKGKTVFEFIDHAFNNTTHLARKLCDDEAKAYI
jgi:transposase-like protein